MTPVEELAREVETWRRQRLRVGFTNGCFDMLHRGHVAYLDQARGWCDRLVVALNTDASVRRLKGEGRSFADLARATFAAAGQEPRIGYIDMPEVIRDRYQYFTEAKMDRIRAAGFPAPPLK